MIGSEAPSGATLGLIDAIAAGGFTTNVLLFPVSKGTPIVLVPVKVTRYDVGALTTRLPGMKNVTRRVLPVMVVTELAGVVSDDPPPDRCKVTTTPEGAMVPVGKLLPVRLIG